ncbi:hypothetical protein EGW08_015164 [Elysia chlorotica]|uniref:Isopentenyl phosphate kinase n=1 Tax=Elysia chlorotica TaxID=188477 RepID=A0A433T6B5_ELYCH|nr:hypothetical protein EGW08_015164 [Elysia chlorotica]
MVPTIDAIIKIGGSAITEKDELETLKSSALPKAFDVIRKCRESGATIIVVHGAGSFGHHHAKKFEISKGISSSINEEALKKKMMGFSLTRQSVQKVKSSHWYEQNIKCIKYHCSRISWRTNKHEPVGWPRETICLLLKQNFVPVLHGDACMDESDGFSILSGDTIIKTLCSHFDVRRAVFLTDVAGVYDRPPSEPDAQLLKSIFVKDDGTVDQVIGTSQSKNDVTGGMLLKLNTATKIVSQTRGRCLVFVCALDSCDSCNIICSAESTEADLLNTQCTKIMMA